MKTFLKTRIAWRSLWLQASFSFQHMQALGWWAAWWPALKVHQPQLESADPQSLAHTRFYNTHPLFIGLVLGEALHAIEHGKSAEQLLASRDITMGPLGGLGDALMLVLIVPLSVAFSVGWTFQGSWWGPVMFVVVFSAIRLGLRFGLLNWAYRFGSTALLKFLQLQTRLKVQINRMGLWMMGVLIAGFAVSGLGVSDGVSPWVGAAGVAGIYAVFQTRVLNPRHIVGLLVLMGLTFAYFTQ